MLILDVFFLGYGVYLRGRVILRISSRFRLYCICIGNRGLDDFILGLLFVFYLSKVRGSIANGVLED